MSGVGNVIAAPFKAVGSLFSPPRPPAPVMPPITQTGAAPETPPTVATPAVAAAADAARMRERAAAGRAATMLTASGRSRTQLASEDLQPTVATISDHLPGVTCATKRRICAIISGVVSRRSTSTTSTPSDRH